MTVESLERRQGKRLKEARIKAGYGSAREAALANDWPESTYRAHEGGWRTLGRDDIERYVRVFRLRGARITSQSIMFPDGPEETAADDLETAAYRRGWDDAIEHVQRALSAPAAPPAPKRPRRSGAKKRA